MNIVILTDASFPEGMGAASRIQSYSRGFIEESHGVTVLVLRPTMSDASQMQVTQIAGWHRGIEYVHCSGMLTRPPQLIRRIYYGIKGLGVAIRDVAIMNRREKVDCCLLVSNSLAYILAFFVLSRIYRIAFVQEKSEFPFVLRSTSVPGRIYAVLYTAFVYKLFDGMFVMTDTLRKYFRTRIRKGADILVVPMTVEADRFAKSTHAGRIGGPYVAYCGDMSGQKDGLDILISAFARIAKKHRSIKLCLIGGTSDPSEFGNLKNQVESLGISGKVVFTGRIDREDMPEYLCNATVLALARPSSLQSAGGFPTKLGEYLATGRPVVLTRVGEIDQYVEDDQDVFFCEPDNAFAFAERMEYVLSHPGNARRVGRNGQFKARSVFDYKAQSKRLLEFLETTRRRRAL